MIYLDNSSTTRQADEVSRLIYEVSLNEFGNPSSLHRLGIRAEGIVREAREKVARAFGAEPEEVFFNSCGTEGDNTAIFGTASARGRRGRRIVTTKVEHPAVLEACRSLEQQGYEVVYVGVDDKCMVDIEQLKEALTEDTILASVMTVNNETGTVMPVREIASLCHQEKLRASDPKGIGVTFHTDAVQAFGKVDLRDTGADLISMSGHKIHGPKGTGALYVKKGAAIRPFLVGGGQERHMRSGTENVPGIAGLGLAADLSLEEEGSDKMREVRNYLLRGIREEIRDIRVNSPEEGCPAVLNVSFLGTRGEVILHTLEESGIYVSTGSACSSNKKGRSHVLEAMGLSDKEIEGAIRFSFSRYNTIEEMDEVLVQLKQAVTRFRRLGSFR